jgi:hypothetical protein
MIFAQPLFLIALAALAIPVIIHLFNFRRYRKVFFTNVKFIAEIQQETKKRSQLKHLLILLSRLLAIASLILAFAQPYIPSSRQQRKAGGTQAVSIYIDNSFSMEALNTGGRLLDEARNKALEIAGAYRPSDLFQLLTTDFEGKHQRFVSRDEFRNLVAEVKLSPSIRSLGEVMKRQADLLKDIRNVNKIAYLITDFQKSTCGLQNLKPDTTLTWFFLPLQAAKQNNLYIDSAWFDNPVLQPSQPARLSVRIRNSSDELLEKIPLQLSINGIQKTVASFAVEPSSATTVALPFTNNAAGIQAGILSITDYPVTWDDNFFFSYRLSPAVAVLSINGETPGPYLGALFDSDSTFIFRNSPENQLDFSSFGSYPLIILNGVSNISSGLKQEITRFVMNGGNILVFPTERADQQGYNELLSALGAPLLTGIDTSRLKVSDLNTDNQIFRDVFEQDASGKITLPDNADLPVVFRHYRFSKLSRSSTDDLIKLQDGESFLTVTKAGKGKIFLASVSLDEKSSTFPRNTIFVPTLFKIALLSQPLLPLYYSLSADDGIPVETDSLRNKEVYRIKKATTDFEAIPETHSAGNVTLIYPHDQIREAGLYTLLEGSRIIQGIAFNYDRRESDLHCYTPGEVDDMLKRSALKYYSVLRGKQASLTKQILDINQGTPLWKYFVFAVLFFLLTEIILIRFLKD